MTLSSSFLKPEAIDGMIFPQVRNFCAVASAAGAASALLGKKFTQAELHANYGVGAITKLNLDHDQPLKNLKHINLRGRGFSNWDTIRLFNALMLDHDATPHSAVLCGKTFVNNMGSAIFQWFEKSQNQMVVHLVGHYCLVAGWLCLAGQKMVSHLLLADSLAGKGPLRSLPLTEIYDLATQDERYGLVLLASAPLDKSIFPNPDQSIFPPESLSVARIPRKGPKP